MKLSSEQKHFFIKEQGIKPFVTNFFLNGLIAWLVMMKFTKLTLWGDAGFGNDILATGFLLPFLSCVIISPILLNKLRKGKLKMYVEAKNTNGMHLKSMPFRALWLGVLGLIMASLPVILFFEFLYTHPISLWTYVIFKSIWAGILGGIVTPIIAYWAVAKYSENIYTT
ncbi:MAG: hypothetical protein JXR03_18195 [Cyclobacteriaceae bacterium]